MVTEARLRIHPRPEAEGRRAFGFSTFSDGLDACRRILRRGATPAVLRLYDQTETQRNFGRSDVCGLIVLDEGDPGLLTATLEVVDQEVSASPGAVTLDQALVGRWLEHRNDVSALAPLWQGGIVVDTAEVAGPWRTLPTLADDVVSALRALEGTLVASVHESHAYPDGACLYFTFAGRQPEDSATGSGGGSTDALAWQERYYVQAWDTLCHVVLRSGCALSHHHGVGLNRARFLPEALGRGFDVLTLLKKALDPRGIMNPGVLGLSSPFGDPGWP